jgi:membrane fusion protein, multidrug efflux system
MPRVKRIKSMRPRYPVLAAVLLLGAVPALAQQPAGGPPAVGVAAAALQPVRSSLEFVGRVQATDRVTLVARVTAFIDQRFFAEGAEVKKGDVLYRLEQAPFQADIEAKQAAIDQFDAQLQNANVTLARFKALLSTPAGQQSNVDAALANQLALKAQRAAAEAQLRMSQINLGYTEIRAPIDGKIGRTAQTIGNVVSPSSGVLATIVSQDPMYVVFPVPVRTVLELRNRLGPNGGLGAAVVKVRLPNGDMYGQEGKLDFVDNTVSATTDTIALRGVMPNPPLDVQAGGGTLRALIDNELVTIVIEEGSAVEALAIPRAAVLADQQGDYVYVVGPDNVVQQRRVKLGQSTPATAIVAEGLSRGETVIVDGIQRVRPGQPVSPTPASPSPSASAAPPASGSSHP